MFLLYTVIFVLTGIYLWVRHVFSYWERAKFPSLKPSLPFGNFADCCTGRSAMGINVYDLYLKSSEPIVGIYVMLRPMLLARDANLCKSILTTDFASFHDRGVYHNPADPVADHMLMLPGQEWRWIRNKLTPTFTSGKLKGMMPTIIEKAAALQRKLKAPANNSDTIELKELCIRYAMDVVGTVAFGLDVNSVDNPDDSFREIEKLVNNGELINRIRLVGAFFCPKILTMLHMSSLSSEFKAYMIDIVKSTMEHREANNVSRKDFIQLLMELRKTGKVSGDEGGVAAETSESLTTPAHYNAGKTFTIEQCAAQVALFYLAGFDTTASAISYCLYELSRKPQLMKRAQREIDQIMSKHNDVITYEMVKEMSYLELCVREAVRKYPTLPFLNRMCTKDYPLPNSDLVIPEGTPIVISLLGLMRDANNFPDPDNYWPDRFAGEQPMYNPAAFLPFGDGPRACIGVRLGTITTKIALISLLHKYDFACITDQELEFDNHSVTLAVKGGINVRITDRKKN